MNEYTFTLKFRLPEPSADPEKFVDALAEAGCDDALVGIGQKGRIALDFIREGSSAFDAIASAVRDVKRAIPGAELVEASPDLVGLTDVAEAIGCTRQNMRKLMVNNFETFPVAVHEGTTSLWHLVSILDWLRDHQRTQVDGVLMEIASTNMKLNIAKETRRLAGTTLPKELDALLV